MSGIFNPYENENYNNINELEQQFLQKEQEEEQEEEQGLFSKEPSKERKNGYIFDSGELIKEGHTSSTKCTSKLAEIIKNMEENKPGIITIVEATDYTKEIFIDHIYDNDNTKYTLFEHTEEVAKVIIIINKEYQEEYEFVKLFGMNLAEDDYRPLLALYSKEKEIFLYSSALETNTQSEQPK